MAIQLKADNRQLTKNAQFSYLSINYASAVSSLVLVNSNSFAANDYVLLGEFGSETAEIVQVSTVTAATHTLALSAATKFAHSESTRATILKYNQVKFYRTATATFSESGTQIGSDTNIQADDYFTRYWDTANTTGYGWFKFYNSTTATATDQSNAIPYTDFESNSVKKIFDSFYSLLNNSEQKLISTNDAFRWLNEGYAIAKNELNLINRNYTASSTTITVTSGTAEYALPSGFSDVLSLTGDDSNDSEIENIALSNAIAYGNDSANTVKYYLRGSYIGLVPTPTSNTTYTLYYLQKTSTLTSYYDSIDLPDNNFYPLVDFMMYRASQKLNKPNPETNLELFRAGINLMKVTSIKRTDNLDSWDIKYEANI